MKRSFWGLIWSSFLRIQGVLLGVIALVLALLLWLFSPNKNISLRLALPVGIFCIILILTLVNAAHESFKMAKRTLPRVLRGKKPSAYRREAKALCLLEPSELFSYGTTVSFYYVGNDNFEQLIGIGEVINIQENRIIQVILTNTLEEYKETVEDLVQNKKDIVEKIIVKPNVPRKYLDIFRGG